MPPAVLIIGDVRLYCDGLAHLIRRDGRMDVVGPAYDAETGIATLRATNAAAVLIDLAIPGAMNLIRACTEVPHRPPIVALSVPESEFDIILCAEAGVSGYVARDADLDQLVETILTTLGNGVRCPPRVAMALLRRVATLAPDRSRAPGLTRREREVLGLIDSGLSNKEIARRLGIELSTAKNHVHHILEKLGVGRRIEALMRHRGPSGGAWSQIPSTSLGSSR
ncbi:MAG TPA: response regulator transcription factor [Gemmatimonadales bacterium]